MNSIYTRLINREHPLPADYIPEGLVDIGIPFDALPGDPKRLLEKTAALAALELINRSHREGLNLCGVSGYRSYERQKKLYTGSPYVAPPGTSEHQSGLALDVSCPQIRMELTEEFAETREGIWLLHHAPIYGFILRYPANKEHITQVPYEPWHIRYVTKPLAAYLSLTGITLEEYHEMENNGSAAGGMDLT
ncbi:MAG: M15 family metallopeptidase [Eubacteriales bacterium]|nr:M15 family metallopeptidase [Eubacteriales bacterium]